MSIADKIKELNPSFTDFVDKISKEKEINNDLSQSYKALLEKQQEEKTAKEQKALEEKEKSFDLNAEQTKKAYETLHKIFQDFAYEKLIPKILELMDNSKLVAMIDFSEDSWDVKEELADKILSNVENCLPFSANPICQYSVYQDWDEYDEVQHALDFTFNFTSAISKLGYSTPVYQDLFKLNCNAFSLVDDEHPLEPDDFSVVPNEYRVDDMVIDPESTLNHIVNKDLPNIEKEFTEYIKQINDAMKINLFGKYSTMATVNDNIWNKNKLLYDKILKYSNRADEESKQIFKEFSPKVDGNYIDVDAIPDLYPIGQRINDKYSFKDIDNAIFSTLLSVRKALSEDAITLSNLEEKVTANIKKEFSDEVKTIVKNEMIPKLQDIWKLNLLTTYFCMPDCEIDKYIEHINNENPKMENIIDWYFYADYISREWHNSKDLRFYFEYKNSTAPYAYINIFGNISELSLKIMADHSDIVVNLHDNTDYEKLGNLLKNNNYNKEDAISSIKNDFDKYYDKLMCSISRKLNMAEQAYQDINQKLSDTLKKEDDDYER